MTSPRTLLGFCIIAFISLSRVKATCVWNSDFGFTLDCAFKKSSLFRVRNLGGIKTHVGLGFTVGDDLLFPESLGNSDSKRRSVSNRENVLATANTLTQDRDQIKNVGAQKPKKNRLTVRIPSSSTVSPTKATTVISAPFDESALKSGRSPSSVRQLALNKVAAPAIPPFKPIPTMSAQPAAMKQENQNALLAKVAQVNQNAAAQRNPSRIGQVPKSNFVSMSPMRVIGHGQNTMTVGQSIGVMNNPEQNVKQIAPPPSNNGFPQFQAMPASTTKVLNQGNDLSKPVGSVSIVSPQTYKSQVQTQTPSNAFANDKLVALRKVHEEQSNSFKPMYQQAQANFAPSPQFSYTQIPNYVTKPVHQVDNGLSQNIITGQGSSSIPEGSLYEKILAISKATNISVEAIEAAIKLRQQQLISQMLNSPPSTTSTTTTTTTTTTTERPLPPPPKRHTKPQEPAQKVMNAPKEYYPVGYDKNFDDNFETKVDLPETSFYCGDQKHFPGLYGDEDLGCMVFHVCALTDEGLIMKSFLCPESTLFDQTILKCNWWFYVDCKNTRRLYDSNIPISKSYQLMKALTFFSSYKKETLANDQKSSQTKIEENKEGVNNAIRILHKQSHMELPKVEVVETQSNRSFFSLTNDGSPVDAVEVNSLSTPVDESENHAGEKVDRSEKQVNVYRPTVSRSNSVERKRNISRYVPKTVISPTSSSFQVGPSTQKSVKISTSQEKKIITRRPTISRGVSKENITKSSEVSSVSKENHRSERASAERIDKDDTNVDLKPVLPTVVTVQEVTSNSKSQVVTPSRQSVNETIAKLDEAIMGTKKPS